MSNVIDVCSAVIALFFSEWLHTLFVVLVEMHFTDAVLVYVIMYLLLWFKLFN